MENENMDNKELINLTDEQLKEVAGGISPFNNLEYIKAEKCNSYKIKECFESGFCVWNNGKCVLKKKSL